MIELNDKIISEAYINSIILRLCEFANGSELYKLDELDDVLDSYTKTIKFFLANYYTGPLYLSSIKLIAKTFFENNGISSDLRTTDVAIGSGDFIPADKSRVPYLVQEMLQTYNINSEEEAPFSFSPAKKELDIYDNEALLHITFVRIQPFEDGNKRMANLLTVLNFLKYYGKKDVLPPVLKISQREEYFAAIRDNDYRRLGQLYRESYQLEKDEFNSLSNIQEQDDLYSHN